MTYSSLYNAGNATVFTREKLEKEQLATILTDQEQNGYKYKKPARILPNQLNEQKINKFAGLSCRQRKTWSNTLMILSHSTSVKFDPEGKHNPSSNSFSDVPSP